MNDQRKVIYEQRRELMASEDIHPMVEEMAEECVNETVDAHIPDNSLPDQWDIEGLHAECMRLFGLNILFKEWLDEDGISAHDIKERIKKMYADHMQEKEERYNPSMIRMAEKTLLLRLLDHAWKDHLLSLDHVRQGINLRAYAQGNPLNEYKREAFNLFQFMLNRVKAEIVSTMSHFDINMPEGQSIESILAPSLDFDDMDEYMPEWAYAEDEDQEQDDDTVIAADQTRLSRTASDDIDPQDPSTWGRVQRNAVCPCGSGKKYKQCHGAF
jgi:preprotein translocase subunit SecA